MPVHVCGSVHVRKNRRVNANASMATRVETGTIKTRMRACAKTELCAHNPLCVRIVFICVCV